jgi:hypothetical protein
MGNLNPIFTAAYAFSIAAFLGFEFWAVFNKTEGDTFSEHIRAYFRTKGKIGSFVFLAVFGTFAAWFAAHIVRVDI